MPKLNMACATEEMRPALTAIWAESFGDDEAYITAFMDRYFAPERSVVALLDGKPVGMEVFLPCSMDGQTLLYGYALGVPAALRHRGIARAVNAEILRRVDETGVPYIMNAASESLVPMYVAEGILPMMYYKKVTRSAGTAVFSPEIRPASAEEYTALRDARFTRPGYVKWSVESVDYAIEENRACGGFADILRWQGEDYALFGRLEEDGSLLFREVTLTDEALEQVSDALCAHYGANGAVYRLPIYTALAGETVMNGLGYGLTPPDTAYLSLMLD